MAGVLTFLGIVLVLTVTPGADMALIMRNVLRDGLRAAWPTQAGIFSGIMVHVMMCVLGFSVVLRESPVAFDTVKLLGAAWLAWLGACALLDAFRTRRPRGRGSSESPTRDHGSTSHRPATRVNPRSARRLYLSGLLTNLLNVKIALFYIAFLPQFVSPGPGFIPAALGLAAAQAAIGAAWLASYAVMVDRAGRALHGSMRTRRLLEGSTGIALLGFGLRLATAGR